MALTKEDLLAIGELMDTKLVPINRRLDGIDARLDRIEEDIEQIKEDTEITRGATNSLVDWADQVSVITRVPFPVKKAK